MLSSGHLLAECMRRSHGPLFAGFVHFRSSSRLVIYDGSYDSIWGLVWQGYLRGGLFSPFGRGGISAMKMAGALHPPFSLFFWEENWGPRAACRVGGEGRNGAERSPRPRRGQSGRSFFRRRFGFRSRTLMNGEAQGAVPTNHYRYEMREKDTPPKSLPLDNPPKT